MRILVLADVESKYLWDYFEKEKLDGIDLILSCGDLKPQYLSFLASFSKVPILYVHGNHDDCYEIAPPDGCICIENKIYVYRGVRIMGLGGSVRYNNGKNQYTQAQMKQRVRKMWLSIKKHKGIDILIKAINESNERGFDIKLVVVGDYKKIKTKDKNVMNLLNSANNNVLFTGFVPNDKLYDILSQSLALVLPTHYEGFGLPPLESLYLGGNAIITDLPVLREVYSELPVSFFKEGDVNALAELLMLKLQLNTDVAKTRQYIDCHYNFEIIADKIIQVIENHHVS